MSISPSALSAGVAPAVFAEQAAVPLDTYVTTDPVPCAEAVAMMEIRVARVLAGERQGMVWFLEHPEVVTCGTSATEAERLRARDSGLTTLNLGRGGRLTYHGPGQRVVYFCLDLKPRGGDVRRFVRSVESWIIGACAALGLRAWRACGRVGVWVQPATREPDCRRKEDKIAALGMRVRRGVIFYGVSVNVCCDLERYRMITPCGISPDEGYGVTSLERLGVTRNLADADRVLLAGFRDMFGDHWRLSPVSLTGRGARLHEAIAGFGER